MIIERLHRFSFAIKTCCFVALCVYIAIYFALSYSALQREITLLRLETQQNRQEIDAMKRTQAWMQDEIFYMRGKK